MSTPRGSPTGRRGGTHRPRFADACGRRPGRRFGGGADDDPDRSPAVTRAGFGISPTPTTAQASSDAPPRRRGGMAATPARFGARRAADAGVVRHTVRAVPSGRGAPGWGSPGEQRVARRGNATRPQRIPERIKAPESIRSSGSENDRRARGDGDVDSASREGKALEGRAPVGTDRRRRGHASRPSSNPVNPRVGCGMQQAHGSVGGGSRRGGEEPRGRNASGAAAPGRSRSNPAGVDSDRGADGGAVFEEPYGRRSATSRAAARGVSPAEATGPRRAMWTSVRVARPRGMTPDEDPSRMDARRDPRERQSTRDLA